MVRVVDIFSSSVEFNLARAVPKSECTAAAKGRWSRPKAILESKPPSDELQVDAGLKTVKKSSGPYSR